MFENFEQKPPVEKKSEENKETEDKLNPVTSEEMEKWNNLKNEEFRLASKGKWESQDTAWLKNQENLREIELKRESEREKLTGPAYGRIELLTDSEKQKKYMDFLSEWSDLNEEERMKRLDRVYNELGNMEKSSVEDKENLMDYVRNTEKSVENYLKFPKDKNFRPLKDGEDREWQKLVDKYKLQGGFTNGGEYKKLSELEDKGQIEQEVLFGPDLGHFGPLISEKGRKAYSDFIEQWNALGPEEQKRRLGRLNIMNERYNTPMLNGNIPRETLFERVLRLKAEKEKK